MKKLRAFVLTAVTAAALTVQGLPAHAEELTITAPSAVVMEASTGQVLYEKDPHQVRSCASITKVMTLCLVFEAIDDGRLTMDQMLTVSAHAASMGGSDIWLEEGESMSVDDLIKATVIMSANDAAVVLAEAVSGSEEAFVTDMNEKAKELGMNDTVFKNCNGLDEEGHVTSAYDVALMSRELMTHEKIFDYTLTWMDSVRNGETQLVNTNKLIRSYQGITGLKTGTTSQAGSCITATAERDGLELIAVVLGADSTDHRFQDAAALLDYGFANWKVVVPEAPALERVPVSRGMAPDVAPQAGESPKLLLKATETVEVETEIQWKELTAPIRKGDVIGTLVYSLGGETLAQVEITAGEDVEEVTFSSALGYLMRALITL
jgi:D-alanyl-D-alanine carboxypeptidase (penicillin-binding protein 5/6)